MEQVFESSQSTQDLLRAYLLERVLEPGSFIASKYQLSGRGRRGSAWLSPPGNLAVSIWVPFQDRALLSLLPLLVGLELAENLEKIANLPYGSIQIKWPNDLWLHSQGKCAGLLCEWVEKPQAGVIVGLGLNLVPKASPGARCIEGLSFKKALRIAQNSILNAAKNLLDQNWDESRFWRRSLFKIGDCLSFQESDHSLVQAKLLGLDPTGALKVQRSDGKEQTLFSQDLQFLRSSD